MFNKSATFEVIARIEPQASGDTLFTRVATANKTASHFANSGFDTIDIKSALDKVANQYDISKDPHDYIFEAVRAVTAGVPNENGDAFHKNELLRFDHRLGCAVYQTFKLKPHHVNHRADNPKTARGVILDTHYNDSSTPMAVCPKDGCGNRTAEREARDATGLYCKKCGSTVKDEFVEILIAVDKKKDPAFADGVRTGVLNATSMGCTCSSTTCNVCDHVAYSRNEFCAHIKSGKKKVFKTASGEKVAFEWCNEVIFTEDSRVDQPADPKALQSEVLQLAAAVEAEKAKAPELRNESDILILSKRLADLELAVSTIRKSAQLQEESKSIAEYVKEKDTKASKEGPMSPEEVGIRHEDGAPMPSATNTASLYDSLVAEIDNMISESAGTRVEGNKMATPDLKWKHAYENLKVRVTAQGNVQVHNGKGTLFVAKASSEARATKDTRAAFARELLTHIAEHGLTKTMNKYKAVQGPKIAQVLKYHVEDMATPRKDGDTAGMPEQGDDDLKGDKRTKPADKNELEETDRKDEVRETKTLKDDVLKEHAEDMEEGRKEAPDTTQTPSMNPQKEDHEPKKLSDTVLDGEVHDHQVKLHAKAAAKPWEKGSKSKPPEIDGGDCDCGLASCPMCHPEKHKDATMKSKGSKSKASKDAAIDKECEHCKEGDKCSKHKSAALATDKYESRLDRLYKNRLAKVKAESTAKIADAVPHIADKFKRALKLAAARQRLNLEDSPIKVAFADVLLDNFDLTADEYYPGMDSDTAVAIIERAAADGFDPFVEQLVTRAAEFMKMSDETFGALEADVANLQPVSPPVTHTAAAAVDRAPNRIRDEVKRGNLELAPAPTERLSPRYASSGRVDRESLRGALGNTKLIRNGILSK